MNDHTGGSRGRQRLAGSRPAGVLAAAVAGVALLAAACGGGSSAAKASSGGSPYQKALAYAQCMRSHGDPSWPDPNSQGNFVIASSSVLTGYQSANKACKSLEPSTTLAPAEFQQKLGEELKYTACMRSHGVSYPEPNTQALEAGKVGPGMGSFNDSTPQFQSASQACRPILSRILGSAS